MTHQPSPRRADRFRNRDGVGVLVERLSQRSVVALHRWFRHPAGGASGRLFLHRAPLLDTLVDRCARRAQGENGALGSSQVRTLFGLGLELGLHILDDPDGSPYPLECSFEGALSALQDWDLGEGPAPHGLGGPVGAADLAELVAGLERLAPGLRLILEALARLTREVLEEVEIEEREGANRLLVFAGLLAAGVQAPVAPKGPPPALADPFASDAHGAGHDPQADED